MSNIQNQESAIRYVQKKRRFYSNLIQFGFVSTMLILVNLSTNPDYMWSLWVIMGWGILIIMQKINTVGITNFLDSDWEKRQIEKRLQKLNRLDE